MYRFKRDWEKNKKTKCVYSLSRHQPTLQKPSAFWQLPITAVTIYLFIYLGQLYPPILEYQGSRGLTA